MQSRISRKTQFCKPILTFLSKENKNLKGERTQLLDLMKRENILPDNFNSFIALFNGLKEHLIEFSVLRSKILEMKNYQDELEESIRKFKTFEKYYPKEDELNNSSEPVNIYDGS